MTRKTHKDKNEGRLDLMPQAAARPRGTMVWFIGLVLLLGYFMVGGETAKVQHTSTLKISPSFTTLTEDNKEAVYCVYGLYVLHDIDLKVRSHMPISDAIASYTQSNDTQSNATQSNATQSNAAAEVPFEIILNMDDTKRLFLSVLNRDYLMGSWSYKDYTDNKLGVYTSMMSLLTSLMDLKGDTPALLPDSEVAFNQLILGLGAYRAKQYIDAEKYLLDAVKNSPSLTLAKWTVAKIYEDTGQRDQARLYYMQAVELDPKLSKYLPDWVLGLK